MLVHFQRYQCIEFVRPFPNLIESLDRSATQTAKQMDVAVGEKNTAGFGLGSYGNSQKIAEVCYVKSLPWCLLPATGSAQVYIFAPGW